MAGYHEEEMQTKKRGLKIAGLAVAAFTAVASLGYVWSGLHSHNGSEFKIVMNKGVPKSVSSEGLIVALGWYDKVHSFPMTRQITSLDDSEVNLRSRNGEEFIGGIRVEYQFRFGNDEEQNKKMITTLFRDFNITDTTAFWDTNQIDPVEKTVNARAKTASVAAFATIATDEFQGKMDEIAEDIRKRLQAVMDRENLPIDIKSIDTSGVSPSKEVQERINRIASESREGERADIIIQNAVKVKQAAAAEAEVTLAFTEALRAKGYTDETIVTLNCQRLADRADRFGIPFGVNCQGGAQPYTVTVDPAQFSVKGRPQADMKASLPAPAMK